MGAEEDGARPALEREDPGRVKLSQTSTSQANLKPRVGSASWVKREWPQRHESAHVQAEGKLLPVPRLWPEPLIWLPDGHRRA